MRWVHFQRMPDPLVPRRAGPLRADPTFKPMVVRPMPGILPPLEGGLYASCHPLLWLSDEDSFGWSRWCVDEGFRLEDLSYAVDVELDLSGERALLIDSREGISQFTERFQKLPDARMDGRGLAELGPQAANMFIDWQAVRSLYDVMAVTPYQWDARLSDDSWYYAWDCACAVVFDPASCIVEVGKPRPFEVPERDEEEDEE